jgi:D-serine deaminase-like pyridoxal phosphate-dependent protein
VLVDSVDGALQLIAAARVERVVVPVVVELDVDGYRCGIDPSDPDFLRLCRLLSDSEATEFRGLMSYAGASYRCSSTSDMADLAERHRLAMVCARAVLSAVGIEGTIFSFGSTPATYFASSLEGFTEARCGIYMFQDLYQAGIGACEIDDIALSVLTTVIGTQPALNRFTIDAGALALSKDRSTQGTDFDAGFGLICDSENGSPIDDLYVSATSQELGLVTSRSQNRIDFRAIFLGRRLRVLPNHADMTAAAHDSYHVVNAKGRIVDRWGRVNGWEL